MIFADRRCMWCDGHAVYTDGTGCQHGPPPVACTIHGGWTDLNLVSRGRRAVIKCTHHGGAWVVLYANPVGDDKEHGSYTIQFAMMGVGQEQYNIGPRLATCPHRVYDKLVEDMRGGARPSANRVPDPQTQTTDAGKELPDA